MKQAKSRRFLMAAAAVWIVVTAFAAGIVVSTLFLNGRAGRALASGLGTSRFSRLSEVYDILMEDYYKPVDGEVLVQGAIDGMMASLDDRYTFYYTPEEMREEQESMDGEYVGVGMVLELTQEGELVIAQVYRNSPAEQGGLMSGDRLIKVFDTDVSEGTQETLNLSASMIRGEEGTSVTVTVLRDGQEKEITCVRGKVEIEYASYELRSDGLTLLTLSGFKGNVVRVMNEAVAFANENGSAGIIVDLRSNPGGQLDIVLDCLDIVMPQGLAVYMEDRNGNREEFFTDQQYDPIPMAVLIDGYSASASELFTGAVQDRDRGTVLGTTSFGKGIVQTVHTFASDGAGLQYTSEVYYTPSGHCVHGEGITPDIEIADDPDTPADEALERAAAVLLGE